MKRVFVISKNDRLDMSPAEEFGEVVYVIPESKPVSPFRTREFLAAVARKLDEEAYDPSFDFVALSGGSTIAVALFLAAAVSRTSHRTPHVNALMFDANQGSYAPRRLTDMQGALEEVA